MDSIDENLVFPYNINKIMVVKNYSGRWRQYSCRLLHDLTARMQFCQNHIQTHLWESKTVNPGTNLLRNDVKVARHL